MEYYISTPNGQKCSSDMVYPTLAPESDHYYAIEGASAQMTNDPSLTNITSLSGLEDGLMLTESDTRATIVESREKLDLGLNNEAKRTANHQEFSPIQNSNEDFIHYVKEIVPLESTESQKLIKRLNSDGKGINLLFMERVNNFNEDNYTLVNALTESSDKDLPHSIIRNGEKYVDWNHPIYSRETKQLADPAEIRAKIKDHYIVDKRKKMPYICQIAHECFKHFTNDQNVENHIFGYFYFIICPNCGKYYKLLYRLNRHLKTCKQKANRTQKQRNLSTPVDSELVSNEMSNSESGDKDETNEAGKSSSIDSIEMLQKEPAPSPCPSINLNKQESELSHIDETDDLTFPTYSYFNAYRVYSDEIKERVKNNYMVDYANSLPYICKLDHNCAKCFSSSWHVENHVFSSFFFIQCPNCGKIFNFIYNGHKHIKICTERLLTIDESLNWDGTPKQKVNDSNKLKLKRERSELKYEKWIHPVYNR